MVAVSGLTSCFFFFPICSLSVSCNMELVRMNGWRRKVGSMAQRDVFEPTIWSKRSGAQVEGVCLGRSYM